MSELVAFLEARLDEDEAVARDAALSSQEPGPWWVDGPALNSGLYWVYATEAKFTQPLATHVARHDPARVLREVTAKRAILAHASECGLYRPDVAARPEWYSGHYPDADWPGHCDGCRTAESADAVWLDALRALAAPFSDHPDFQEQWR